MESDKVLVHMRFAPNGVVVEIGERPRGLTPHEWFNYLSEKAGDAYQAFSGGRGVFRLGKDRLEELKAASAA